MYCVWCVPAFGDSPAPPFRSKFEDTETSDWLKGVLSDLAEGPLHANVRGVDMGQLLPLARLEYPRLILEADLPHPRLLDVSRVNGYRHIEPWRGYYRLLITEADRWVHGGIDNAQLQEKRRAAAAKAVAFAYVVTGDQLYLEAVERAFQSLAPLPSVVSFQGGTAGIGWGDDIEMGEALLHYAVAYDLTVNHISLGLAAKTADKFAQVCDRLVSRMPNIPPDNHAIVVSSGVGSMALAIADYSGNSEHPPQDWLDAAMALQSYALAAQVMPDGTYKEGPYYARFIAGHLLPFYHYIKRIYQRNLARHPRVSALFDWLIITGNPDGSCPHTDDSWQDAILWEPLLMPLARDPRVVYWCYQRRADVFYRYHPNMVDALANATFLPKVQAPTSLPSRIYPDGGMAIFKDSWEADAFQVLAVGEPTAALGGRHEQVDPGNLLINIGSEPMLVDAGYGPGGTEDPDREGYLEPGSHNMILLDNRGPERNPLFGGNAGASINGGFDGPIAGGCRIDMQYGDQPVTRRILVPGHQYILLEDMAPGNFDAEAVSLFHASGNATPDPDGGVRWGRGNAALRLIPLSPPVAPSQLMLSRSLHSHQPGRSEVHHRIEMAWGDPDRCTALLIPGDDIQVQPLIVSSDGNAAGWVLEGVAIENYGNGYFPSVTHHGAFRDVILLGDGSEIEVAGLVTDAYRVWWRESSAGDLQAIAFRDAHWVDCVGIGIRSSSRVTGTFWGNGIRWWGMVECGDGMVTWKFRGLSDPGVVRYRGHVIPYECQDGTVTITIAGDGALEFGSGPPGIWVPQPHLNDGSFLEEVAWTPDPQARLRLMSPYDQARMEGEILSELRYGLTSTLDPWMRDRWGVTGGGEALVGFVLGMTDAMTSSQQALEVRIPHRTRIQRQIHDVDVSLEGEGFWGDEAFRRYGGRIGLQDCGWIGYSEDHPFQSITRREIEVGNDNGTQGTIEYEDGPDGDLWGGTIVGQTVNYRYHTGIQWGTEDLNDWRWGQWEVSHNRWSANVTAGQDSSQQSVLVDLYRNWRFANMGYRYQYLDRGEFRNTLLASRSWDKVTTTGSWAWTAGTVPSDHVIRNYTSFRDGPWLMISNITSSILDSTDIVLSGVYSAKRYEVGGAVHGSSESSSIIPDRMAFLTIDPAAWSTVAVEGRCSGEAERTAATSVILRPDNIVSFHGSSQWDREYSGPNMVSGGWWWQGWVFMGGDVWRQWFPYREDGCWVSVVMDAIPVLRPMGSMEIRWDGDGAIQEVMVRVESDCGDVGPGILYLEEPGLERRFEGYFRLRF